MNFLAVWRIITEPRKNDSVPWSHLGRWEWEVDCEWFTPKYGRNRKKSLLVDWSKSESKAFLTKYNVLLRNLNIRTKCGVFP